MQDSMQVYRFANGSDIITIAAQSLRDAECLAGQQAQREASIMLLDVSNPESVDLVMSIYKNVTRH